MNNLYLYKIYEKAINTYDVYELITLFANAGNGYYLSDHYGIAIDVLNNTDNSIRKVIATTALLEGILGIYFLLESLEKDPTDSSDILQIENNINNRIDQFWKAFHNLGLGANFLVKKYTLDFSSGSNHGTVIESHPLIAFLFLTQYRKMNLTLNDFLIDYSRNLEKVNDIIQGITGTNETYIIDEQTYETNLLFDILYEVFRLKIKGGTIGLTDETTKNLGKIIDLYHELIDIYSINTKDIIYNIKLDPENFHFDINFKITLEEFENIVLNNNTLNQQQKRW